MVGTRSAQLQVGSLGNAPGILLEPSSMSDGRQCVDKRLDVCADRTQGWFTHSLVPLSCMYKDSLSVWYSLLKPLHIYSMSIYSWVSFLFRKNNTCMHRHTHTHERTHAHTHMHTHTHTHARTHTHAHTHEDQRLSIAYMCINHM